MRQGLFNFDQATTVAPGSITNAMLANMAARTVKVNATNASASPQDLQATVALTYLRLNAAGTGIEWGALPVDPGVVTSVFTRTGAVVAVSGDYAGSQVTNVPAGNVAAVTTQAAINELDTEKAGLALANVFTLGQTISSNTSSTPAIPANTQLYLVGADAQNVNFISDGFGAPPLFSFRRANGTSTAKTQMLSGDLMVQMGGAGYTNAAAYSANVAAIRFTAAENFTGTANGAVIQFRTTAIGGVTAANRWSILDDGSLTANALTKQGNGTLNAIGVYENNVALSAKYLLLAGGTMTGGISQSGGDFIQTDTTGVHTFRGAGGNSAAGDGSSFIFYNGGVGIAGFGNRSAILGSAYSAQATAYSINGWEFLNGGTSLFAKMYDSGALSVGNSATNTGAGTVNAASGLFVAATVAVDSNGLLRARPYTVGTLPSATGIDGARAQVSDSLAAPVFAASAVGGGTVHAPVYSDNVAWRYG